MLDALLLYLVVVAIMLLTRKHICSKRKENFALGTPPISFFFSSLGSSVICLYLPIVACDIVPLDAVVIFVVEDSQASLVVKLLVALHGQATLVLIL